jgi:tRNA (guanine37-N1)-methyltransferase
MIIDVLTLFPGMFRGFLGESILKIAQEKRIVRIRLHDIRDYSTDRHRKVDDRPYGGGPGMVLRPEPIVRAVEAVLGSRTAGRDVRLVLLTPTGRLFDQRAALRFAGGPDLLMVCGHYEGFDERVCEAFAFEQVSIGDFVLTGGEIPALAIIDAVVRLLPGALGDTGSAAEDSFATGLLEYPHYTRPPIYRGMSVPEVLLSGDHERIRRWRRRQAIERTLTRRSDLLASGDEPRREEVPPSAGLDESNLERR